ncbi:MAG: ROK family protein [Microbacteriaceae bacterium]
MTRHDDRVLLGIDYGGTQTKVLIRDAESGADRAVEQHAFATPRGADALGTLAGQVRAIVAGRDIDAAGITVAGVVDEDTGVVHRSANLPWLDGANLHEQLAELLGTRVQTVHDGRAMAVAESVLGAGRGSDDVFVIALGTGVAGAHVHQGVARRGAHGAAGEIGHIIGDPGGRLCTCGQRGCLETLIGGAHLADRWSAATGSTVTARELFAACDAGDRRALEIVDEATGALASAVLGLIAAIDPDRIVLGGGVGLAGTRVLDALTAKVRAGATFHQLPPIVPAELGVWAGAHGALLAAAPRGERVLA